MVAGGGLDKRVNRMLWVAIWLELDGSEWN